jgi:hypothetical protein
MHESEPRRFRWRVVQRKTASARRLSVVIHPSSFIRDVMIYERNPGLNCEVSRHDGDFCPCRPFTDPPERC